MVGRNGRLRCSHYADTTGIMSDFEKLVYDQRKFCRQCAENKRFVGFGVMRLIECSRLLKTSSVFSNAPSQVRRTASLRTATTEEMVLRMMELKELF